MPLKIQLKPYEPNRKPYPMPPTMWAGDGLLEAAEAGANHGVVQEIFPTAWISGDGKRQFQKSVLLTSGDYSEFSPVPPKPQSGNNNDSMACVSVSYCGAAGTILTTLYHQEKLSEKFQKFLEDNHYFDEYGRIVFDYRMLAKESGTARHGNSLDRVAETARKIGLAPYRAYDWSKFTWEDFYGEETSTHQLELGKELLSFLDDEIGLMHVWILMGADGKEKSTQLILEDAMQYGPIQFATTTHATVTVYSKEELQKYFDSYAPWNKERNLNKVPMLWAKQIFVVLKEEKPVIPYLPYFEKLPDPDKAVYVYGKDTDTMIAVESGEAYHAFVGVYTKVKTVKKLSRPVDSRLLRLS